MQIVFIVCAEALRYQPLKHAPPANTMEVNANFFVLLKGIETFMFNLITCALTHPLIQSPLFLPQ